MWVFELRPLSALSPNLLEYTTDLIIEFCSMIRPFHCDKLTIISGGARSFSTDVSVMDKYHNALHFYNECIIEIMTFAPPEQIEKVFPFFSLRDISTYCVIDRCSGYSYFKNLLHSQADEKWKIKADEEMRKIILDELSGKAVPREKWEDALHCYADIIDTMPYSDGIELLADQYTFLTGEEIYRRKLIKTWRIPHIYETLSADVYKCLRRQIAKAIVLHGEEEFSVYTQDTLYGAKLMLAELEEGDQDAASVIRSAIERYKKINTASLSNKKDNKKDEEIVSMMK